MEVKRNLRLELILFSSVLSHSLLLTGQGCGCGLGCTMVIVLVVVMIIIMVIAKGQNPKYLLPLFKFKRGSDYLRVISLLQVATTAAAFNIFYWTKNREIGRGAN